MCSSPKDPSFSVCHSFSALFPEAVIPMYLFCFPRNGYPSTYCTVFREAVVHTILNSNLVGKGKQPEGEESKVATAAAAANAAVNSEDSRDATNVSGKVLVLV